MTKEEFIKKAREIHGDKYKYVDLPDEFPIYNTNIKIVCIKHGEFIQNARMHLRGSGCKKCGFIGRNHKKLSYEEFVNRAKEIYCNKYDYSKVDLEHRDKNGKVCIICPEHGEFWVKPERHIFKKSPRACKKCGYEKLSELFKTNIQDFVEKAKKVHGEKYDYSKFIYINNKIKSIIICPEHGEFEMSPEAHISQKQGCPKCGIEKTKEALRNDVSYFIEKANVIHKNKYSYDKFIYVNNKTKGIVTCPVHGDFYVSPMNHIGNKSGCPKCSYPISRWENEVCDFLKEIGIEYEQSNRKVLNGKEIDIFIPNFNIGIECDGIRWHSEEYRDKNFHLEKTNECDKKGIRLIHIFEDEWKYKSEIWKSMLKNMFGITEHKIFARKCEIKKVKSNDARIFLGNNHIQGFSNGKYAYGLYYNNELISLMTFGKQRINLGGKKDENCYELVRFCNKLNTNVIGGASKLFKEFLKDFSPDEVISYSDKRWSTGKLYDILGFKHIHDSKPNYFYVVNGMRENRFKYRKDKLLREGFTGSTEHEIMLARGIYRIYDCGCRAHLWKKE